MTAPSRWSRLPAIGGVEVLLSDSITVFGPGSAGAILVTGSHGGASALAYAIRAGARGVIVNDAGVGKNGAGIGGLDAADLAGVAVAAVSHESARIGNGRDTWARGRVSHVNARAAAVGVTSQIAVGEAVSRLAESPAPAPRARAAPAAAPGIRVIDPGPPQVLLVDSVSALGPTHEGAIVVTGSHGGATHGRALDVRVLAAVFNDAGIGRDEAGIGRLPILDRDGIIGIAVSHDSARIGEALDTWACGVASVVNECGIRAGLGPGVTVQACIRRIIERRSGA